MTPEEKRLLLVLQRFETESDLLDTRLDRFVRLLDIFEKLIHKIRTAFLESRIWEELEEYRQNDGKRKRKSGGRNTGGFDVQRKSRKSTD